MRYASPLHIVVSGYFFSSLSMNWGLQQLLKNPYEKSGHLSLGDNTTAHGIVLNAIAQAPRIPSYCIGVTRRMSQCPSTRSRSGLFKIIGSDPAHDRRIG